MTTDNGPGTALRLAWPNRVLVVLMQWWFNIPTREDAVKIAIAAAHVGGTHVRGVQNICKRFHVPFTWEAVEPTLTAHARAFVELRYQRFCHGDTEIGDR